MTLAGAALGGAACDRGPRPPRPGEFDQSKYALRRVAHGDLDGAQALCEATRSAYPSYAEPWFCLAVIDAHRGRPDEALGKARRAVELGLPVERFFVGPRETLAPLVESQGFRAWIPDPPELLHGPMLGDVRADGARFWLRTLHELAARVSVEPADGSQPAVVSAPVRSDAARDYTAVLEVSGLRPDTDYVYRLELDGRELPRPEHQAFRTYPAPGAPARFSVAFGACSNLIPPAERMWDTIRLRRPLAFMTLGDNVYSNYPELVNQRYFLYRRHSRPEFRRLVASTAIYAIYDDHDFGGNDVIGGPAVDDPPWKRDVSWRVFRENFLNPYYGGGPERPGVWTDFHVGDVHFIMLDGRYYRTDPDGERPTMLGPEQKRWLLETLAASDATFKILVSPVPFAPGTKRIAGGRDTWDGFPAEREEIFSFVERERIEGVFLVSGDRHRSDAWRIERKDGYDLYEATSAHLTKPGSHPEKELAIFSHHGRPMYGLLTFDLAAADPTITYTVVDIDDAVVDSLVVRRSQLAFDRQAVDR